MTNKESKLQSIYLAMISEAIARLHAAEDFLVRYTSSQSVPELEAAILQIRKALEAIAYAAIAPNKAEYEKFRASADDQPDFTKDYRASKILRLLAKVNENFYPFPVLPPTRNADGTFHFDRRESGFLSKKRFESFYDQLGKHLHAHNPWSSNKNLQNLVRELPDAINQIFGLLELHVTFIQSPEFTGAWIVEARRDGQPPRITTGVAADPFIVDNS